MTSQRSIGHSSLVRIVLRLGGQTVPVAQMGPTFLLLKEAFNSPARAGVITLTVDGMSEEIPVLFPAGISADSKRVEITEVEMHELSVA